MNVYIFDTGGQFCCQNVLHVGWNCEYIAEQWIFYPYYSLCSACYCCLFVCVFFIFLCNSNTNKDFEKVKHRWGQVVCVCVSVYVSVYVTSHISETCEAIIKFNTVTAAVMRMHHMLIMLILIMKLINVLLFQKLCK